MTRFSSLDSLSVAETKPVIQNDIPAYIYMQNQVSLFSKSLDARWWWEVGHWQLQRCFSWQTLVGMAARFPRFAARLNREIKRRMQAAILVIQTHSFYSYAVIFSNREFKMMHLHCRW